MLEARARARAKWIRSRPMTCASPWCAIAVSRAVAARGRRLAVLAVLPHRRQPAMRARKPKSFRITRRRGVASVLNASLLHPLPRCVVCVWVWAGGRCWAVMCARGARDFKGLVCAPSLGSCFVGASWLQPLTAISWCVHGNFLQPNEGEGGPVQGAGEDMSAGVGGGKCAAPMRPQGGGDDDDGIM